MTTRTIQVECLTRVEGEGALDLEFSDSGVSSAQLRIFEPPRFFEALLRGRSYLEIPDIVARICGICPVAYQMSAVHAIENAFKSRIEGPLRDLRRLLYCGEWIESHALHVVMLHAPDFLGFPDVIRMAEKHPDEVRIGLNLKKVGNHIIRMLGGREIHPVNVCPGGFYSVPPSSELKMLLPEIRVAHEQAIHLAQWVAAFPFPDFERPYEFVALQHPAEYPFNEGRLVSSMDLDIAISAFQEHFEERQVPHSTALHSVLKRRGVYCVGPMARYALNFEHLPAEIRDLGQRVGLGSVCRNPFKSIVVRAIEIAYACVEAQRIIENYSAPQTAATRLQPHSGIGYGCTEAPRGFCWHRYQFDSDGLVENATIVPPTSQNQGSIENDLVALASPLVSEPDETIKRQCEQLIRSYDPCISCSTHALKLAVRRS